MTGRAPAPAAPTSSAAGGSAPIAASSGAAFAAASRASSRPSESATIPPPAPSQMRSPRNSKVRMQTLSSSPASGLAKPIAPV
jgi:hypothetical protein